MMGRRNHQELYREIERVERDFVQLDDGWGALEKALWQVRYNITIYGRTAPHPDFRAVDDWLLLEAMLVAAIEERDPLWAATLAHGAAHESALHEGRRLRAIGWPGNAQQRQAHLDALRAEYDALVALRAAYAAYAAHAGRDGGA